MKKRTKKIICIILAILMVIEIVACSIIQGNPDGFNNTDSTEKNTATEQTSDKDGVSDAENSDSKNTLSTTNTKKKVNKKKKSNKIENTSKQKVEQYTITFIDDAHPDSGETVTKKTFTLENGKALGSELYPTRKNYESESIYFLGYYFDKQTLDYPFLENIAYNKDITVYARYGKYQNIVNAVDYVFEEEVGEDFSVVIKANEDNTGAGTVDINARAYFYEMQNAFEYIESDRVEITDLGGGNYRLRVKDVEPAMTYGFYITGGYTMVSASWTDGLTGAAKSKDINDGIRFISYEIYKEEKDVIYRDNIKWIKFGKGESVSESDVHIDKTSAKQLGTGEENAYSNEEEPYVDHFKLSSDFEELKEGQVVCFYKGINPKDRKYANTDNSSYLNQEDVYFCIVEERLETETLDKKTKYNCRYVEQEELYKVLLIPQVIPFKVGDVPTKSGTVLTMEYDSSAWTSMGGEGVPEAIVGDFVVFYDQLDENTEREDLFFGKVVDVVGQKIKYETTSYDNVIATINEAGSYKISPDLKDDSIISDSEAENLEKELNKELKSELNDYSKQVEEMVISAADIDELTAGLNADTKKIEIEKSNIGATVSTQGLYLTDSGAKLSARIGAVVVIKIKTKEDGDFTNETYLHYVVSASFVQEFNINLNADGQFKIGWHVIIPYIKECWFSLGTGVQLATHVNMDIRHYTSWVGTNTKGEQFDDQAWNNFLEFITCKQFITQAAAYYQYESQYELYQNSKDENELAIAAKAKSEMERIWDGDWSNPLSLKFWYIYYKIGSPKSLEELKKVKPAYTWIQSFASQRATFKEFALNTTIVDLIGTPEEGLDDKNLDAFVKKYQALMKAGNTWIRLYDKRLAADDWGNFVVVPGVLSFVVNPKFYCAANVNIGLNSNFHFQMGKLFSIKVDVKNWDISTSSKDTMNQSVHFSLVAMGTLGFRAGVTVDLGIKLLLIFNAGFGLTFAPYFELDGYAFLEYTRDTLPNSAQVVTTDKRKGALYIEFGLYFGAEFKIKVAIFGSKSWTLGEKKQRIFWFGEKENVYKFDYKQLTPDEMEEDDNLALVDGSTGYKLSERWRMMGYMDMTNGRLSSYAASAGHYTYKFYDLKNCPIEVVDGKIRYKTNVPESKSMTVDKDGKMSRKDGDYNNFDGYALLTWKEPDLAFSNYVIRRVVHILFSYDPKIVKHPVKVTIVDKDNNELRETVWTKDLYKGRPYTLPSKKEIMEIIDKDGNKYVASQCNYKDADETGVPSYISGTVTGDMEFIFYVKRQSYSLDLHYLSFDNKEKIRTYTALYGDSFGVSDTDLIGTRVKVSDEQYLLYSALKGVYLDNGEKTDWSRDWNDPIDGNYAKELKDNKHYIQAVYKENTVKVTYKFSGIQMDPVSKKVESGTIAPELKDIWNTDDAGVMAKLREKAGLSADDPSTALSYTIEPARGVIIHDTTYLVQVKVDKLQKPYVVTSDRGNVTLDSPNTADKGEKLYYGVSTSDTASPMQITWYNEAFVPNLKADTTYYFYCRKLYDYKADALYSPASDPWSWHEDPPTKETSWRNGVRLESSSKNTAAVDITTKIVFFDSASTETQTVSVAPGETVYTADFTDRHDPWMISKIYVQASGKWSGSVNTFSYNSKYGKDLDSNRTESSSVNVVLAAGAKKTYAVNGPKRRIKDIGDFNSNSILPDTIVINDPSDTHIVSEGEGDDQKSYWVYSYNGSVQDQFSIVLDEQGKATGFEPYNSFEHYDPPHIEMELINDIEGKNTSPLNFIKCSGRKLKIDAEQMVFYLGSNGSITVKVKLIFPERSTFIGTDTDGTELSNVFERTITIKTNGVTTNSEEQ